MTIAAKNSGSTSSAADDDDRDDDASDLAGVSRRPESRDDAQMPPGDIEVPDGDFSRGSSPRRPLNVFVRESDVVPAGPSGDSQAIADAHRAIGECDAKMARYQAAIDAGADIAEVTKWINATKAVRIQAEAVLRSRAATPRRMTRREISAIVERFASLAAVIRDADPADKAEIYNNLNRRLGDCHARRPVPD